MLIWSQVAERCRPHLSGRLEAPGPDSDRSEVFMGDILLKILFAATGPEVRSCELSELIQCFYEVFLRSEVADCEHVSPHALPEPVQANLR